VTGEQPGSESIGVRIALKGGSDGRLGPRLR
jgi:hypothetical protein